MRKTVAGLVFAVWCAVIAGTWNNDDAKAVVLQFFGGVVMLVVGVVSGATLFAKERE